MNINSLIDKIKSNLLDDDELIQCLNIPNNMIQNYAIQKIVERKITNSDVIETLVKLSYLKDLQSHRLFSYYSLGHIAIAALHELETKESFSEYESLFEQLSDWDKEVVEKLIVNKAFKK